MIRRKRSKAACQDTTNLSLCGDKWEDIPTGAGEIRCHNICQKSACVKGTGLDKHADDGFVQSTSFDCVPHSIPNVLIVQDESCDDREGEEDIEQKGNCKVWGSDPGGKGHRIIDGCPKKRASDDTRSCTDGIS